MNESQTYEALVTKALFGELSAEEQVLLDAYLEASPERAAEMKALQATLQVVDQGRQPEPSEAYMDGYYDRLMGRIEQEESVQHRPAHLVSWWHRLGQIDLTTLLLGPRWTYQLSGAVALIAIGVLLGWLVFRPAAVDAPSIAQETPVVSDPVLTPQLQPASLEARTSRYLDRSKVLLLGLVNADPEQFDPTVLNLEHKQEVARELIDESEGLKGELTEAKQQALHGLLEDLEVILLQIANLEAGHDLPAIELVKSGVDRRAILLKINLSEMRMGDQALQPAVEQKVDPTTF